MDQKEFIKAVELRGRFVQVVSAFVCLILVIHQSWILLLIFASHVTMHQAIGLTD